MSPSSLHSKIAILEGEPQLPHCAFEPRFDGQGIQFGSPYQEPPLPGDLEQLSHRPTNGPALIHRTSLGIRAECIYSHDGVGKQPRGDLPSFRRVNAVIGYDEVKVLF